MKRTPTTKPLKERAFPVAIWLCIGIALLVLVGLPLLDHLLFGSPPRHYVP